MVSKSAISRDSIVIRETGSNPIIAIATYWSNLQRNVVMMVVIHQVGGSSDGSWRMRILLKRITLTNIDKIIINFVVVRTFNLNLIVKRVAMLSLDCLICPDIILID